MTNGETSTPTFWQSFNALMDIKGMSAASKFELVGLKKELRSKVEDVRETMKDYEGKEDFKQQMDDLMKKEFTLESKPVSLRAASLDQLSSEDLFQLEKLINVEEN